MAFNEDEIKQLAKIRGQEPVLCRVGGRDCWLMADPSDNTLDKLAQSLSTDSWDLWREGLLAAYDKSGDLLFDTDAPRTWSEISPIEFREMRWAVVAVAGMSRGNVMSEHKQRYSAEKKCTGLRHGSVQILFLQKGSRGKEVALS